MIFNTKISIVLFILAVIGLGGLLAFSIHGISSQNRETAAFLERANESASEEILIQTLRKVRDNSESEISRFEDRAFTSDKTISALEELEAVGRSLGVVTEVVDVNEIPIIEGAGYGGLEVSLNATGSWAGVFTWLQAVESLPYRVEFKGASFSKQEDGWRAGLDILIPSFN